MRPLTLLLHSVGIEQVWSAFDKFCHMVEAVGSTLKGDKWQPSLDKIKRCLRVQNFITHIENYGAPSVQAKGERVISHDAIFHQFIWISDVVDPTTNVSLQSGARCDCGVDRNERTVKLSAQPSGKEAAKACSDDKRFRMTLQPCCKRLEDQLWMEGVVDGNAVNRAHPRKGTDLGLAGVEVRTPTVAIENLLASAHVV